MAAGLPVNTQRRDWFRIIRDLSAAGVSMSAVARKCNRSPTSVVAWADGGDPKETDARIVLALYWRHCPLKYLEHQKLYDIRTGDAEHLDQEEPADDDGNSTPVEDAEGS